MTVRFISMEIQVKDITCDWRTFITCSEGDFIWQLRGYGNTPDEAVRDVWEKFNDRDSWTYCGETLLEREQN